MRVLIVEDHTATAALLIRFVWKLGHTSESAPTLALATEAAAISTFDVALIDLELPDGSGDALARLLQEKRIRCIALSHGQPDLRTPEMACFTACLAKPINFEALRAALELPGSPCPPDTGGPH